MRSLFTITIVLLFYSLSIKAQVNFPKGDVKLIEFNNNSATFTVPSGKIWYINAIFKSFGIAHVKNNYLAVDDTVIRIKNINGKELTNLSKNIFGPRIPSEFFPLPLILPENTTIIFEIFQGEDVKIAVSDRSAYINYVEINN